MRWALDCSDRRSKGKQGTQAQERDSRRFVVEEKLEHLQLASRAEEEEAMALAAAQYGDTGAAEGWMARAEAAMDEAMLQASVQAPVLVVLAEPTEGAAAQARGVARSLEESLDPAVLAELKKYWGGSG